jgi:hypothetical protein
MLYRVPAIEIGLYDKTRFDTAAEERQLFMESTLMPQAEAISACIQHQVIDPHFRYGGSGSKATMSKSVSAAFESARAETDSDLIFLIDTDTLPIAHKVKAAQAKNATELRHAYGLTMNEVANLHGIEMEQREERDDIYLLATERNVTKPHLNPEVMAAEMKVSAKPSEAGGQAPPSKKKTPEKTKAINNAVRELRRLTLRCADSKEVWSLENGNDCLKSLPLKPFVAKLRHDLRDAMRSGDADAIRAHFNGLSLPSL